MKLRPTEIRDPGLLLTHVAQHTTLREGDVAVVLVEDPSTTQRIVSVTLLDQDTQALDSVELSDALEQIALAFDLPRFKRWPFRHAIVTVVARRGLAVLDGVDGRWSSAWRWANHLMPASDGDLILVTEHGWFDLRTHLGGAIPCLR